MKLKTIFSRFFLPRIRGIVYHFFNTNNSSGKFVIFKPLLFTNSTIKWGKHVTIMQNARIEGVRHYCKVPFNPRIIINDCVSIQQNIHLTCGENITIEDNVAIAANVTITDIHHPYTDINTPIENQLITTNPVRIGKDSKIYNNVVILPGSTIGEHCVIGANSVVSGNIPSYSIVVGAPGRIVKRYNFTTQQWERTHPDGSFMN